MIIIQSQRDEFWDKVDTELLAKGLRAATNGELESVIRRTTCPRKAAELIERRRGEDASPPRTE
jgi:hypothetical protein